MTTVDKRFVLPAALLCLTMLSAMAPAEREENKGMHQQQPESIKLPAPDYHGVMSVEEALHKRRSVRVYREEPVSLGELSQLLWAAQGQTASGGLRTAPSAGALYPLEVYVVAGDVKGLAAGLYRYEPGRHELLSLRKGDIRNDLCAAALGQPSVRKAALVLVLSGVYERTTVKYGERGIRYVHMEAGHAAQNVYLQAEALHLGTVSIGAFSDREVKALLKMTGKETPLYIMPIGKK